MKAASLFSSSGKYGVSCLVLCCFLSFSSGVQAGTSGMSLPLMVVGPLAGQAQGGNGGNSGTVTTVRGDRTDYESVSLTSAGTYSSADSGVSEEYMQFSSSEADTPAIKVASGGSLTASHSKMDKSGDTADRESSGFYGVNAEVLASSSTQVSSYSGSGESATLSLSDCTITTDASGANGVFAFGEDAAVTLDYVTIVTTGSDNARGVDATYGGSVTITNSVISTTGDSCAALATDRYESYSAPTIDATNCEGTTAGSGSPGIYCTGTFTVADSTLTATNSEAAAIEGSNSITLTDTDLSGAKKWGVIIYQSTSGDSSVGTGTYDMTGGTLTNNSTEPMFVVCNTSAVIDLTGVSLENSNSDTLLWATTAAAGSAVDDNINSDWGTNGGTVEMAATNQTLEGDIDLEESSSTLTLTLTNSSLNGAINGENQGGDVAVTLDSTSSWYVTGTSYLTTLTNNGTISGTGTVSVDGMQYYTP